MPRSRDDWQRLLEAARRKLAIATYHADCLEKEHASASDREMNAPAIPIQAHFEGVIVSVMAAVDQVAQALNTALRLRLGTGDVIEGAFASLTQVMPDVDSWFREPIGRDLRRIRVRMIHYSYAKTPHGPCWVVESAGTDYGGPRKLLAYARSAVEYGERLRSLLPLIEAEIAVWASPPRATKASKPNPALVCLERF